MIIAGLIGEAIAIVVLPSGGFEKTVSVFCTLIIALGVWVEGVGGNESEATEKAEYEIKLAELKVRADDANKAAEDERLARLSLEESLAPRRLSADQKNIISASLSSAVPLPIAVVCRLLDFEGKDFAEDLASALEKLKWPISRYGTWTQSDKGLFIAMVEPTALHLALIATLSSALTAAGIEHKIIPISARNLGTMMPHFEPNVLYLLVGAKPEKLVGN